LNSDSTRPAPTLQSIFSFIDAADRETHYPKEILAGKLITHKMEEIFSSNHQYQVILQVMCNFKVSDTALSWDNNPGYDPGCSLGKD